MQTYSDPTRESDPHALPDVELFQLTAEESCMLDEDAVNDFTHRHEFRLHGMNSKVYHAMIDAMIDELGIAGGWYYWYCFPGCLPDGDPIGPFATAAEAEAAAQEDTP